MLRLAALAVLVYQATAECPRGGSENAICSGRGECDVYSRCLCSRGFEGPSCELRQCPSAEAWSMPFGERTPGQDAAGFQSSPHLDAECAGRGLCDRATGHCSCQFGFEGAACERMSCPLGAPLHDGRLLPCSGRGLCTDLARLAHEFNFWDFPRPTYTEPWDKEKIYGCLCDEGYSGYDCSLSECAVGDDPLERNRGTKADFQRDAFQAWRDTSTSTHVTQNSRDHGTTSHAAPKDLSTHVISDYSAPGDRRVAKGVELIDVPLVNEVQLVYCQANSGWFTLRLGTRVSDRIDAKASALEMQRALESTLGVGPLKVSFNNPAASQVCGGTKGGDGNRAARMDNVVAVEFLKLTGRAARMQAFTGGDASVPPVELEDTRALTPYGSAYVSLAHGDKGSLLGAHSVATNRGAEVCSGRGLCEERTSNGVGGGSCTCQEGFIASDGLVLGGPGGLRLSANGLPHPGEGQGTKNPALRFRRDSLPSPAYEDCGALDPAVFPSAGYAADRAAGEGKGVGGGACPGAAPGSGFGIQCSGHGACSGSPVWRCACEVGWNGYDCSLRACPTDRAWFDFPRANDEAHWSLQECAGRGHCNRELGVCECEAGFRGAACATLDCPVGRIRSSSAAGGVFDYSNGGGSGETSKSDVIAQQQLSGASGFTQLRGTSSNGLNQLPASHDTSPGAVHQSVHHAVSGSSGTSSSSHGRSRSIEPDAPPGFDEHSSELAEVVYEATTDASSKSGGGSSAPLQSSRSANAIGLGPGWTQPPPGTTCSGHGACLSQSEHAKRALDSEAETDFDYGPRVSSRTRYSAHFWDADRLSGCLCDDGWTGYDCSLRTCPRGDDPSSYGQVHEDQLMRCLANPGNGTTWFVKFRRDGSALAAPESVALAANASAEDVQRAIEGLSTVGSVEVALLNGGQVMDATSEAVQNATESCAPRRAGDALLVMPEAPSVLFTGTPRQLRVALTAWPASAVTLTVTCRLNGPQGAPCNEASELNVWPRNFTFLPRGALRSKSGNSNLPVTGASPPPQYFNVTAYASGRYALTAAWGSGYGGNDDDDSGAFVALANASVHAATALSGPVAQATSGAHTILRAFRATADSESVPTVLPHLATPDLGALNLTLLPGSTETNLTVTLSEEAWAQLGSGGCYTSRQGSGCDNDNYGDDLTKTLVVTPTATTVSSSSGVVSLSFEPSSVTLSRANPSAAFAVRAAASSGAGSARVAWGLSGALAANVSAPGTLTSTDSGAATISVVHVAKVLPPPRLPPVYRSAASAVLTLRLASSPPVGSGNLTVTPTLGVANSAWDDDDGIGGVGDAQGAAAVFDPPSLVFVPGGPRSLGFRIVGRRVGLHNLTYELSGSAASLYQVARPRVAAAVLAYAPGGDGGDDSTSKNQAAAVAVAGGAWPLTVAAAPVLRVRFLTESGALPRLRARAKQLPDGADPGAHVEIYSGGAVALGEYAAPPSLAAADTPAQSSGVVSASQSNGLAAGTALALGRDLLSVTGTAEAAECSDRGICDRALGTCRCFDGYRSSDGNGKAGTRGDCGFLVPDIESLWENQQPPDEALAEARE